MVCAVKGHILHQRTKFKILTVDPLYGANVRHRAKFHQNRSNGCRDIAIFVIFQDGGRRHFGFLTIRNFNDRSAVRGQYASLYQILSKWICWAPIGTTYDEFLLVSIVVQNLVEIDALVSIT